MIPAEDGEYSDLQVCQSGAGYYIGRMFKHNDNSDTPDLVEPGSRESDYYATRAAAEMALNSGEFERDVPENRMLRQGSN